LHIFEYVKPYAQGGGFRSFAMELVDGPSVRSSMARSGLMGGMKGLIMVGVVGPADAEMAGWDDLTYSNM
jgi:hypothetical protein